MTQQFDPRPDNVWLFFFAVSILGAPASFGLSLLLSVPLFVVWRLSVSKRRKLVASTAAVVASNAALAESNIRLFVAERPERERRVAAALPLIQAFEQLILQKFDSRPCPRCAELDMQVLRMSPNGRSCEVHCLHCHHFFRWKAVHPDTTDVTSGHRNLTEALAGTGDVYLHKVHVPPSKFSTEGGRELIPQGVRQMVWRRDGGRCVQCGADVNLHFDHIIPVAKGGATTVENIQILCAPCNLSKGARI